MGGTIIVVAVFAVLMIGAPWTAGAAPMPPIGTGVAPIGTDVAPIGTDKESPANDDHVVGDSLC